MSYEEKKEFFEAKRERKLNAFQRLAEKNTKESAQRREYSQKLADAIPFGQPILVGHHSERMHRNHLEKIRRNFDKSIELADKAEHYKKKVENLENPHAISSDDPDAITKLKQKLADMELEREAIKAREHKAWELSNLSANIRRVKQRIAELEAIEKTPDLDKEVNGVHIFTDKIENRVKISFPEIPSQEIRAFLKSRGFHWSPYGKVWQRMLSNAAIYTAEELINMLEKTT